MGVLTEAQIAHATVSALLIYTMGLSTGVAVTMTWPGRYSDRAYRAWRAVQTVSVLALFAVTVLRPFGGE